MITRIVVRGYKSLDDFKTNLEQIAVVAGPNASGKSNVLDALELLRGFVTERTLARAFETSHRGRVLESCSYGSKGLKGLRDQSEAFLNFEIDVKLADATIETVTNRCEALRKPHEENPPPRRH